MFISKVKKKKKSYHDGVLWDCGMVLWNLIKMTLFLEITALPCWRRLQEQTDDGPPEWKVCDMEGDL